MSTSTVMRPPRRLLYFLAGLGLALLLTIGLAFLPPVQTRVAWRLLASHPEWGADVERVSLSPGSLRISGLKWLGNTVEVSVPDVVVEFDPADLIWRKTLAIRALRAKDVAVTVRESAPPKVVSNPAPAPPPVGAAASGPGRAPPEGAASAGIASPPAPPEVASAGSAASGSRPLPPDSSAPQAESVAATMRRASV